MPDTPPYAAPVSLEDPGRYFGLRWERLTPGDVGALDSLVDTLEQEQRCVVDSMRDILLLETAKGPHEGWDGIGGFNAHGDLRAYAALLLWPVIDENSVPTVVFFGGVDPKLQGRGIGRDLLIWQDGRARQLLAGAGVSGEARFCAYVPETSAEHRRLYVAEGFSATRGFERIRRDLEAPLPSGPALPSGVELVPAHTLAAERVLSAYNASVSLGWAPGPYPEDFFRARWQDYVPEWSWVARRGQDVVGFVLSEKEEATWSPTYRTQGVVHRLGAVPECRGFGLGRALGRAALQGMRTSGIRFATALVDWTEPHGGGAMYDALGFTPVARELVYELRLDG